MNRAILILAYFYAPAISARAFRWSALAERWAGQGCHVEIVTSLSAGVPAYEQKGGVHVYRVNHPLMSLLQRAAPQGSSSPSGRVGQSRLVGIAVSLAYRLWRALYWPDAGFLWRGPALRQALRLAAGRQYDAMISVSPFFTAHLVGESLRKRISSGRWLVDCGDPFSFQELEPHNNPALYRTLNRRVERRIFHKADAVSVTTPQTASIYAAQFPESAAKIHVIPPLVSSPPGPDAKSNRRDDRVRMMFAGALYPATRRPDFLLKLFDGLMQIPELADRLELHIYGDSTLVRSAFQPHQELIERGRVVLHGMVSRQAIGEAMAQADILINIGNQTPYQLPSKVIEIASTGKPILNLVQIANDSSAQVYQRYPATLTLLDGGEALEEQVERLAAWIENPPPRLDSGFLRGWLAPYQIDAIAAAYDHLLCLD